MSDKQKLRRTLSKHIPNLYAEEKTKPRKQVRCAKVRTPAIDLERLTQIKDKTIRENLQVLSEKANKLQEEVDSLRNQLHYLIHHEKVLPLAR
jgi:hypothetical protein